MDENTQANSGSKSLIIPAVAVVVILAIAGGGFFLFNKGSQNSNSQTSSTPRPTPESTTSSSTGKYKNGTYSAEGDYVTHGGPEKIAVKLTLTDDKISDVDVTEEAVLPMSKIMQEDFIANYKTQVVGKNIDEVKLSKVSGSSLTPIGFNDALAKIKTQAKS